MKRSKPTTRTAGPAVSQPLSFKPVALAVAIALSPSLYAQNLPTGLQTVSGSVTVTNPTATSMSLNQASQNANMNAQSFSIGSGYRVDVHQPNTSSLMMMNVVGNNPSSIYGTLTANGQFWLVNPAGVMFAPGSNVDVGGLVATTLPVSYADATSGRYVFTGNGGSGSVINQGRITALNGYVGLFAPNVINEGVIVARLGSVALAAGNQVTLDMVGDGLIKVAVTESALNAAVMNKGSIEADGGNVLLTARSASALLDTVINTEGVIRANTISERNGTIVLDGGDKGVVSVSGTVEARGADAGTTGGTVKVLGEYVGVGLPGTTASINASGDAGGGTILLGGNFQGKGPEANAFRTYVGEGASIKADAVTNGNGGKVILWSDDTTRFYGDISARGGASGGDGGFAEVSGKQNLGFYGLVSLLAPAGRNGTMLLDPGVLTVVDGVGTRTPDVTFGTGSAADTVGVTSINLNGAGASVLLQAGQLRFLNTTDITMGAANNFTVNVSSASDGLGGNDTITNAGGAAFSINTSGAGVITMTAVGAINLTNVNLNSTVGGVSLTGASIVTGGITSPGGTVILNSTGTVSQTGTLSGSTLDLRGTGGTFNLDTQNNSFANLKANTDTLTSLKYENDSGFNIQGISTSGDTSLLSIATVTQSGPISAAGLELRGLGGTYVLDTQNNPVTTLAANTGTVQFQDNSGFSIGTVNVTTGLSATIGATLTSTGTVTQTAGGVITTPTLTLTGVGGTFNLDTANNSVTTLDADNTALGPLKFKDNGGFDVAGVNSSGNTTLSSTGAVTQSGVISATGLELLGAGGSFTLNTQNNAITTLAGNTGTVLFQDNSGFAIGTVNTAGLAATVGATLTSTGTVTQTAAGVITTPTLTLTGAGGTFNLATANNAVTTLNADTDQVASLSFKDDTGYDVSGINSAGTVTLESAGGSVTQSGTITATTLTLQGAGGAFNLGTQSNTVATLDANNNTLASVSLQTPGPLVVAGIDSSGAVTLNVTGGVTQTAPINATTLTLQGAAGTFTLNTQNNAITTLDADNTALTTLAFRDDTGYAVAGVNTTGNTTLQSNGGTVTQTGVINAAGLELLGAGGTFTLNTQNNTTPILAANTGTVLYRNDAGFDVGTVNATNGVTTSVNTTLQSNGGTVTQSQAINAAGLELLGGGGTFTLNNAGNAITTLAGNTGTVSFTENSGYAVGTVNTIGLTATTQATLTSTGTVTQTQAVTTPTLTLQGAGGTFNLASVSNAITTLDADNSALTQLQFRDDTGYAVAGVNTTGNTTLQSNGGTVTQTGVITAAGLELLGAGGTFTLNTQNNAITTLAGNTGTVNFQDNTGYAIGTVNTIGLTATTAATLNSTGTVTQTQAITTPTLTLQGAGGTFTLNSVSNAITTLDADNTALTTLAFRDDTGYAVAGVNTTGNTTLQSNGGTVTQTGVINAAGLELLGAGGTFTLNTQNNTTPILAANTGTVLYRNDAGFDVGTVNATNGVTTSVNTTLQSNGGTVTQSQAITAAGLEFLGAGGTFTLNNAGNAITTLAGNTGTVSFTENSGYAVGTVNTIGLTATTQATLTSTGTVTQTQAVTTPTLTLQGAGGTFNLASVSNAITTLDADNSALTQLQFRDDTGYAVAGVNTTGNTTLQSNGGTVTQTGVITAAGLELLGAGGTFNLNTQNNAITTLAGNTGTVNFQDNTGYAIGTVNTIGLTATTAATLNSTGTVTQTQAITTPTLTLQGAGGTFTLNSVSNAITTLDADNTALTTLAFRDDTGYAVAGVNTTGNTTLQSNGGTVTQTGVINAAGLELLGAGGTFTLNTQNNTTPILAANTGTVLYRNDAGFDVGTVNATNGVTTSVNTTLQSNGGTVTQSQAITAAGLELLGAGGTFTLNNAGNAITTLAGNTGTVSFTENSGYAVGTVNTIGLTATTQATLTSTGTVTQTQAVTTPTLTLQGAGGTFNLASVSNAITTLDADNSALTQLQFRDDTGYAVAGVNTTGNTTLQSNGGTVTQTGVITAAGLELLGAGGTFTLNTQNNAITTLAGNTGTVNFQDNTGYAIGTVNTIGLTATTAATLNSTGTVTQTQAITTPTLTLQGAGGTFTLNSVSNAITTLDADNTALTTLAFRDDTGYAVAGVNTTGNTTLQSNGGTVTQTGVINAAGLELLGAGGTFTLNTQNNTTPILAANTGTVLYRNDAGFDVGTVNATNGVTTTGNTTLQSTGAVTQSQAITAAGLELLGAGGTFTLNNAGNAITTLAGNTGTVSFTENSGYAVGTVNTIGLTATTQATLTSTGTVTQTQAVTTPTLTLQGAGGTFNLASVSNAITTLDADNSALTQLQFRDDTGYAVAGVNTTGNTTLQSNGGTVTQTGVITAAGLELLGAGGTFTLNTQNNAITTLAGNTGTVNFQDNTGYAIGTVNTIGLTATTAATLNSTGTVTQTQAITTPTLTLQGAGGTFTLNSVSNAITTLDADNTALTTLAFRDDTGYAVAGVNTTGNTTLQSNGGTVTQTGVINAAGLELLGAGGTFTLNTQNNTTPILAANTGTVLYRNDAGFDVGTVNATNGVTTSVNTTLQSNGGTVTQSQAITAAGLELLGAGGTFTLNNAGNAITTLAGNTGTVSFTENSGYAVGTVNTIGLTATTQATLTSTGTVTQTQAVTTPTLTLQGAGGTFNLASVSNAITTLDADNSALTQLQFRDDTGYAVAGVNTTGNTTLQSNGGTVTQTGVITAAGLELLGAGGTFNLNTQTNAVTTLAGNTGTVNLTDAGGIAVGTVNTVGLTTSGPLVVSTTGAITQSQAIVANSTSSFTAGANAITLTNGGNNYVGAVTLSNSGANNVQITDSNAISLAASTVGQNLTVNSVGVSQTGILTVPGTATFNAGAGSIALGLANQFTGAVSLNNSGANAVQLTNNQATVLGTSAVGTSTLGITSNGAITQTGALTQAGGAGAVTIAAGANPITMTQANDFTGTVTLINSGANAVQITDTNAITFAPALVLGGDFTVNATGLITTAGVTNTGNQQYNSSLSTNGTYTTNGGNFAVTGATTLAGGTTVNAGAGTITFTTVDGAFSLSANSSDAVTGESFGVVGGVTPLASISTDAPGVVTLNGNVSTTGAQTFLDAVKSGTITLSSSGGGTISAGNAANDFTGTLTISTPGGTATIVDGAGGLTLGSVNAATLNATSTGGALTGGQMTVGNATFDAGGSALTLTNGANNFTGTVNLTGGTTQIVDNAGGLTLGTLNTGDLTANSNGAGGALDLGTGTVNGNLVATTSNGNVTQAGALHIVGTTNIAVGSGGITLTNAANDFGGAVTASSTSAVTGVSFTDSGSFTPGAGGISSGTGLITLTAATLVPGGTVSGLGTAIFTSANDVGSGGSPFNIFFPNVTPATRINLLGTASQWFFAGTPGPVPANNFGAAGGIGVTVNGVNIQAGAIQIATGNVVAAAQGNAGAEAARDAADTFGTDSVAEQIEFGFAGDVGNLPPIDHRLQGVGISVPKCFNESREGENC